MSRWTCMLTLVHHLVVDPPTHRFLKHESRHPIRWFANGRG